MSGLLKPESLLIGIDQSYTGFGLVVLDSNEKILEKNLWKFPKKEGDGERLRDIFWKLNDFWRDTREKYGAAEMYMAMEGYSFGSLLNREKMGELGGVVKLSWYSYIQEDPLIVAPTELKKFVTGKGNASKDDMLAAIQKFDPEVTNHNIADAMGLAFMLWSANE